MHDQEQGRLLIALARDAIAERLEQPRQALPELGRHDWLRAPAAVFVTLTQSGALRGCIGSLEAHRSLLDDVRANACAAAFKDPRFPPLTARELPGTRVEVSILTPAEPIRFRDEAELLAQLRPGIDGLILEHGWHRGTFLPQVWEQLPEPGDFVAHLKRKAGLPADFWADDLRVSRYQVEKFKEGDHVPA